MDLKSAVYFRYMSTLEQWGFVKGEIRRFSPLTAPAQTCFAPALKLGRSSRLKRELLFVQDEPKVDVVSTG